MRPALSSVRAGWKMAPMLFMLGVQDAGAVDELRDRPAPSASSTRAVRVAGSAASGTASLMRKMRACAGPSERLA